MLRKPLVLIGCAMTALGLIGITYTAVRPGAGGAPGRGPRLTMRVTDARPAACSRGASVWTVGADVLAPAQPGARLTSATLRASYQTSANGNWRTTPVSQQGTDEFVPGRIAGTDGVLRAHPTVQVALPCGVTRARLIAASRLDCDAAPRYGAAAFVSDGIAMSMSSIGGFVLGGAIAASAVLRLSRPRRNAA
jgi:hypothetical protein